MAKPVTSVETTDNGATYHVAADLPAGQTYTANITKSGYEFTVDHGKFPSGPLIHRGFDFEACFICFDY